MLKRAFLAKDNDAVVKAQEQLAQIAIDQQRLKEAEKLQRKSIEIAPNYSLAYSNLGGIHIWNIKIYY